MEQKNLPNSKYYAYTFETPRQTFQLTQQAVDAIKRYVEDGIPPGGFLEAVICNDLQNAVGLADAWTTSQFSKEHPDVVDLFAKKPYDLTPVGWAVRSENIEWLNFINTALDYCKSTGRMEEWEAKYNAHWIKPRIEYKVD